jgi:hypothetical protein
MQRQSLTKERFVACVATRRRALGHHIMCGDAAQGLGQSTCAAEAEPAERSNPRRLDIRVLWRQNLRWVMSEMSEMAF